ncbi:MAG: hypothetical protein AVDCRST_MAG37-1929 [uncultured Rubrobacteraceae bacterium]|uniref:Uncharacterized protein n=1 Tax=uncultured Rubrobacteraceae bacterium TaxID=349277 RepID=A0A6J4QLE6_9ACTN|nr:MAG: hypothetical protein AVDCRST_MAG37-1929 [uncultured Rubrobacteraceae bacterium]
MSEIRRTERALIWPLILGSSSVATVHHSFQYRLYGAAKPTKMVLLEISSGHGPQPSFFIIPWMLYSRP